MRRKQDNCATFLLRVMLSPAFNHAVALPSRASVTSPGGPMSRTLQHSPPPKNNREPLRLECLEDRSVPATINGVAFYDLNNNGEQDSGEGFAAGVGARVTPPNGSPMNATTNSSGQFEFTGLASGSFSGSYAVEFTPPAGYEIGTPSGGFMTVVLEHDDDVVGIGVGVVDDGGSSSGSGSGSFLAVDDVASTHGLNSVAIAVLANDIGSPFSISSWSEPANGSLNFDSGAGTFTYTPFSRFASANDTFTYTITDGSQFSTATVTIQRVFWTSPTGGSWADTVNWNAGLLPNGEDGVTLTPWPVTIPSGFGTTVWGLITPIGSFLQADGNLMVTNLADLQGAVGVGSTGAVYNATDENGSFVLSGGATIGGMFNTAAAAETLFSGFGGIKKVYTLTGAGDLTGDGLVHVLQSELNVSNSGETVTKLTVESDGSVTGSADLTVAELIGKEATFTGAAGSTLTATVSAYLTAPLTTATVFDVRNFVAQASSEVTIDGDVKLTGGQTSTYTGTTNWTKGNISITGQSRIVNLGEFNIKGSNKVTGGVRPDGTPDGTFENKSEIKFANLAGETRFENVAFLNQTGASVKSIGNSGNRLVFSGGTGVQRGPIQMSGNNEQVVLTDNAQQTAYTGGDFTTDLVMKNGATLSIPTENNINIFKLELTGDVLAGDTLPGVINGGGSVHVYHTLNWEWGVIGNVAATYTSGTPARLLTVSQNANNPTAERTLDGGLLKIMGTANVNADLNVLNGGRILVDGDDREEDATAGVFNVNNASIKTNSQSPGLPFWAVNNSVISFDSDLNANDPTGSIELPVVVDGSTFNSAKFKFQAGLLQRGDSTTKITGRTLVNGRAPTNEGPGFNLRDESIYILGGTLRVESAGTLISDRDIAIKSAATLEAGGIIKVGANKDRYVDVSGTLRLLGDDTTTGTLGIQGNLVLEGTSTTRIRVKDTANDYITATGTISLGGALVIVDNSTVANKTWTIFAAGTDLPANDPKLLSDFDSVTAGFTTIKDPVAPFSSLKLKKGNG